jgi:hypothetical protein
MSSKLWNELPCQSFSGFNRTAKCHGKHFFKPYSIVYNYMAWQKMLSSYLVSMAYDGAAVMLGCKSGVTKLSVSLSYHLALCQHRLGLSVSNTVNAVTGSGHLWTNSLSSIMHHLKSAGNYMNMLSCWILNCWKLEEFSAFCYMSDFLGSMTSAPCRVTMG